VIGLYGAIMAEAKAANALFYQTDRFHGAIYTGLKS